MHYAFETWTGSAGSAQSGASQPQPESEAAEARGAQKQLNVLSEELSALEESLSFNLEDVMANYRPDPEACRAENQEVLGDTPVNEQNWDELARLVADHVLVYLQELQHPLQIELQKMRRAADEYYRDNRAMAVQIRQLLDEREQMLKALNGYETELARYRNVMGNLYLRH